ncbi:MAG TPA: hypothetical protein ENG84_05790 [Gammaproteobacteria bacterium]|nr:hypothetical protein [Gammaproteobacteria bacterium]
MNRDFRLNKVKIAEQIEKAAAKHDEIRARLCAPLTEDPRRFNAVSLREWVGFAQAAGLNPVPAEPVASLPVDVVLRFDCPRPEDAPYWKAFERALEETGPGEMVRWSACASMELKWAMGAAVDPQSPDRWGHRPAAYLTPDDPRAFDVIYEYPEETIEVLRRPWVEARRVGAHPVEYRVFVQDSAVLGISSYYPQRPLVRDAQVERELAEVRAQTERLIRHLDACARLPWHPGYGKRYDPERVHCTLDFLVETDGAVRLLEAGPPWGAGAHPCCFEGREVAGIALDPLGPVEPLEPDAPAP